MDTQPIQDEIISVASILAEVSMEMYEHQREEFIKRGLEVDERLKEELKKKKHWGSGSNTKYYKDIQIGGIY